MCKLLDESNSILMSFKQPFNLHQWIEENRDLLKPPVGNKNLYVEAGDFIVMIVGGPNARQDYHFNESEELFYQIQGDINVRVQQDGKAVDIPIKEGEMFVVPAGVEHKPKSKEESQIMLIEPKGVVNTGEEDSNNLTAKNDVWI